MIPMIYQGGGEFRASSPYHTKRCDQLYGQGQEIIFTEIEERSMQSHRHYFARLKELWMTLPEALKDDFPTPEALRKWALIKANYATVSHFLAPTNQEALRLAAYLGDVGEFIIAEVIGRKVTVWKPMSQSMRAMKKEMFQRSKDDVLEVIERLVANGPGRVIPFGRRP